MPLSILAAIGSSKVDTVGRRNSWTQPQLSVPPDPSPPPTHTICTHDLDYCPCFSGRAPLRTAHYTLMHSRKDSGSHPLPSQTEHFFHQVPINGPDGSILLGQSVQGWEGTELQAASVDSRGPAQFAAKVSQGSLSKETFAGECNLWSASKGTGKVFLSHALPLPRHAPPLPQICAPRKRLIL